jgi:hypothetical protein
MKWIAHVGVAIAVVAGVGVVTASPASAAVYEVGVPDCRGEEANFQIVRCVRLNWDSTNRRFRAHAGIIDKPGGTDYTVSVVWTQVGGPENRQNDADGFWEEGDSGESLYGYPSDCGADFLTFAAEVGWVRKSDGAVTYEQLYGWVKCSSVPGW